ncbi:MAG TPA: hypothetical protein VNO30_31780 [Kofleriaceae bacterium]|nr:hypothetical protein [Kofleriaceae bacterium]
MRVLLVVYLLAPVVALAALAAAGCDSKATASDPAAANAPKPEEKSREYESCGATANCAENLRCFDQVCRRMARSAVGDYHAAVGAMLRAKGEHEGAVAAFAQALGQYQAEKLEVPPDVDCAYGATLAAGRAKRENAELGARVLHRCVLGVPAASSLRTEAMTSLALLGEAGLDPLMLGGGKLADTYLTKAPQKPSSDKVTVSASANPATGSKTYAALSEKLLDASLKGNFVACWEAYNGATKKDTLAVTLPIKVGFVKSEYEDEEDAGGRWFTKIGPATGLSGAEAAADTCVRGIVEPAMKGIKLLDGFDTKVTITIR